MRCWVRARCACQVTAAEGARSPGVEWSQWTVGFLAAFWASFSHFLRLWFSNSDAMRVRENLSTGGGEALLFAFFFPSSLVWVWALGTKDVGSIPTCHQVSAAVSMLCAVLCVNGKTSKQLLVCRDKWTCGTLRYARVTVRDAERASKITWMRDILPCPSCAATYLLFGVLKGDVRHAGRWEHVLYTSSTWWIVLVRALPFILGLLEHC